jgi:hypothetical protein
METRKLLRRKAASKYLVDVHGVVRAPSTLAKYAVMGGGPVFHRMGRDPVYTPVDLDEWVASKLSGPMRSTSDMTSLASEAPGGHLQVDPSGASDNGADGCERRVSAGQPAVNAEHAASEASIDGLALHEHA